MLKRTLASHIAAYLTNKHTHTHTYKYTRKWTHIRTHMYTASKVGGVSWRSVLALPTWPSQVICEYAPARIQVFSLYLVLNCSCSCNRTCNCSPSCSNVHIHTQTQTTYHKCILKCTYTIFTFDMSSTNEMHKNVLSDLALSYQHTHTLSIIISITIIIYILLIIFDLNLKCWFVFILYTSYVFFLV